MSSNSCVSTSEFDKVEKQIISLVSDLLNDQETKEKQEGGARGSKFCTPQRKRAGQLVVLLIVLATMIYQHFNPDAGKAKYSSAYDKAVAQRYPTTLSEYFNFFRGKDLPVDMNALIDKMANENVKKKPNPRYEYRNGGATRKNRKQN